MTDNLASPETPKSHRQIGYDVARALAVIGMVVVNFKVVLGADKSGGDWLIRLVGLLDGRAAATFVILAGVGVSLLSRRAREQSDARALSAKRKTLIKRAAFLFCFGLIYAPVWPADILHFYGIYLLIGAVLLNASNRKLWLIATGLAVSFIVLLFFFDYDQGWNWKTLDYEGFWTLEGMLRHLFFNGFHPVIPWTAFLLVGMWLGRQDMTKPALRKKIIAWSLGAIVLAETASHFLTNWMLARFPQADPVDIIALCGTAPIPPMPFYLLSAGGSALVVIVLCIAASEKFAAHSGIFKPLVATGQLALTLYVAHVVIGMGLLEVMGNLNNQSIIMAVFSAIFFFTAATAFAMFWRRFFKRGPLEWAMRMITR
jgi:uncharacterized membrane protein YeiB